MLLEILVKITRGQISIQETPLSWLTCGGDLGNGNLLSILLRCRPGESHVEDTVLHRSLDILGLEVIQSVNTSPFIRKIGQNTYLCASGQRKSPKELPIPSLSQRIAIFLVLRRGLHLARDSQAVILHVNLDVFFVDTWELERRSNEVPLYRLVKVHPIKQPGESVRQISGSRFGLNGLRRSEESGSAAAAIRASCLVVLVRRTTIERIVKEMVEIGERLEVKVGDRHGVAESIAGVVSGLWRGW